uniref:Uncharacterized protein n=1 Tax=Anguilla anguilla TaxID=7936 RepID=A0A0E9S915_ANGAN
MIVYFLLARVCFCQILFESPSVICRHYNGNVSKVKKCTK